MTFTPNEQRTVQAVFESLLKRFTDDELNCFIGSVTIGEMHELYNKLRYDSYCQEHGIKYEEMTEEEFVDAALESAEKW